jgi:hypothetical protein
MDFGRWLAPVKLVSPGARSLGFGQALAGTEAYSLVIGPVLVNAACLNHQGRLWIQGGAPR